MRNRIRAILKEQGFFPTWIGIFFNPFYFARLGLANAMSRYAGFLQGRLLDVGCGSKPYEKLFHVSEYIGLDIDSEKIRKSALADYFYDGKKFPFGDCEFDAVLCNQVLEHVFNPDEFLSEIHRILNPDGKFLLTVPFVWDEHEQPYDYARYSSFGLKALLKKNNFIIIQHEKIGADASILFQLTNAYLYKISDKWNKYSRFLFSVTIMGFINFLGVIFRFLLPNNPDLFLDHIILAEKSA